MHFHIRFKVSQEVFPRFRTFQKTSGAFQRCVKASPSFPEAFQEHFKRFKRHFIACQDNPEVFLEMSGNLRRFEDVSRHFKAYQRLLKTFRAYGRARKFVEISEMSLGISGSFQGVRCKIY